MAISKDELLNIIKNLNRERCVDFTVLDDCDSKYLAKFTGSVLLDKNESVQLLISFTVHFPLSLPDIFVEGNEDFRAHVGIEGKICLFDSSSILIKQELADQIVIDCFDRAIKILNIRPGSKVYNDEVCREFESYWLSIGNKKAYSCLDIYDVKYAEFPMVVSKEVSVIAKTNIEAEIILHNAFGLIPDKSTFESTCIVVRIREGSSMIALSKQFKWSNIRRYVVDNTSSSIKRQFRKFLDK